MSANPLPEDIDGNAIQDLMRMASLYARRGNTKKASELLSLAEQIRERVGHGAAVNLAGRLFEQRSGWSL
jgi:hypothetical protein